MGVYDEYLTRTNWGPSDGLQTAVARRVLTEFVRTAHVDLTKTSMLEIGSGTGRLAREALAMGVDSYTGVEPTKALATYCRSELGLRIVEDRLPELSSLSDSQFGTVVSMHVLEHAPDFMAAHAWCAEMARVTAPGGSILVAAPDVRDYKSYFWDSDWSHGYPTTPRRVGQLFRDLGLSVTFEGSMHLGRTGGFATASARLLSLLLPTRPLDAATWRLVGRPLASGFKIAALWGLTYVIAKKADA